MTTYAKLLTPGPTPIPESVLQAMRISSSFHHRTDEFREVFKLASEGYSDLVGSKEQAVFLAGSGTLGMEAAIKNLCPSGSKVVYVNSGKFGERWGLICKALGIDAVEIKLEYGKSLPEDLLVQVMEENKDADAFCFQIVETSTAAYQDPKEICAIVRGIAPDTMIIADGITAVGAIEIKQDGLGIDALVCGSQKALMLPPGLAMLTMSSRAWSKIERNPCGSLYMDLVRERKAQEKGSSAWTPAISLVFGLRESLRLINEEGKQHLYKRHKGNGEFARKRLQELGFKLFAEIPADSVTSVYSDSGVDIEKLRAQLLRQAGVRLAGGQGELKGQILRIGHMGHVFKSDLAEALLPLGEILKEKEK